MRIGATREAIQTKENAPMPDVIFLTLGLGGFAAMAGYAAFCAKL